MTTLSDLPSVEQILQTQIAAELIAQYGRSLTLTSIRSVLDEIRARFKLVLSRVEGTDPEPALPTIDLILAQAESNLSAWTNPTLIPVINALAATLGHTISRHLPLGRNR